MPITVFQPAPNQPTGLGYELQVSTDFIGPFPTGSNWILQLSADPEGNAASYFDSYPADTRSWAGAFGTLNVLRVMEQLSGFANGQSGWLRVSIRDAQNQIIEEHSPIPIVLDNQTGAAYLLDQRIIKSVPSDGGFTATDREKLEVVQMSVAPTMTGSFPGGGSLNIPFLNLPGIPLATLLRPAETVRLSGVGSIQRPTAGPEVSAYGATWRFAVVPPGFGAELGIVREWQPRMAQFQLEYRQGGPGTFRVAPLDVNTDGWWWIWGTPLPVRLHYDIQLGVEVDLTWLVLLILQ